MKRILFHTTATLSTLLLMAEPNFTWCIFLLIDIALIALCANTLTFWEVIRYSGYRSWYRSVISKAHRMAVNKDN